jgi:epoxyqueuosine reductase
VSELVAQIKEAARRLGFACLGITSVEPLKPAARALDQWCEAGFAAGMEYMTRKRELHGNPGWLVPYARSLITLAVNYYVAAPEFQHQHRYGRVARYAWGRDYHDVVKLRLVKLVAEIESLAGRSVRARCFVDAVPLLERAAAARAGLGFFGKNTNLIQPRGGSWFFLAEILLDLELPTDDHQIKVSCGSCHRCIDACPTNAFAAPYWLDSRNCISYLTIENKGPIPHHLRSKLGEWVFGCDVCQDVCPFNRFSNDTDWPELHPEAGIGQKLDLVETLSIATDEQFRLRFQGTPLGRPKRRGLLRNAAVVAANILCTAAVPVLIERARHDSEPLIRSHALWALAELDRRKALPLIERSLADPSPLVREEALRLAVCNT